ncbi:MAG TPA: hypothetical protein VF263_08160 [Longimicrobiaceae bacterium]
MTLGTGIYTPYEAAMLLREDTSTVRRWAFGYHRNRPGKGRSWHPPLIHTDLPELEGEKALTFVELIELLYIRAFEQAGVPWDAIREAANVAARMYKTDHPFALRQVYADPRSLYASVQETDGSESLVQLVGHGQHTIPELIKPYLEQLEFDLNDVASRWWPLGRLGGVVVDPRHAFGAPVIAEVGIRTKVLSDAYYAERDLYGEEEALNRVAWVYEINPNHVETALQFKHWLQAA